MTELILLLIMPAVTVKGMTYVSWTAGDYPYATGWQAQKYWDSRGIDSVRVGHFQARGVLRMYLHLDPNNESLSSGEAFVDMRYFPPMCTTPPPQQPGDTVIPVDLHGREISCYVYLPRGIRGLQSAPNGIQLFVKDRQWDSWYSDWRNIEQEESWVVFRDTIPLSSTDVDLRHIIAVGFKIGLNRNATSGFTGVMPMDYFTWNDSGGIKYPFEHTGSALDSLASLHCNYVALINTQYMADESANAIRPESSRTHSDTEIVRTIAAIDSHGMSVMMKPHVDVLNDTWRGRIRPTDVPAWFQSYREFIVHHAYLAQGSDAVRIFCIGTELESMDSLYRPYWLDIVDTVRAILGPSVLLTYAANWTGYRNVCFWDVLDRGGVDAYFQLTPGDSSPSLEEIIEGWTPHVQAVSDWYRTELHKPVLFTEIGCPSRKGAAADPAQRPGEAIFKVDLAQHARYYSAACQVWNDTSWFEGRFWWNWTPVSDAGGWWSDHFTPQNKPAAETLRAWWNGVVEYESGRQQGAGPTAVAASPSPCRGLLRLHLPPTDARGPLALSIRDAAGALVRRIESDEREVYVDLRALPDGVYFLEKNGCPSAGLKVTLAR